MEANKEEANNDKLYVCRCKKTFKHHSSHSRHQKICGQEKPFSCTKCKTTFNRNDALKRHMKKCKPKGKSFQCHKCHTKFEKNWMLQCHLKTVDCTRGKQMKCPYCNKSFKTQVRLNNHLSMVHREVIGINFVLSNIPDEQMENRDVNSDVDIDYVYSEDELCSEDDNMYMSMTLIDKNGEGSNNTQEIYNDQADKAEVQGEHIFIYLLYQ